MAKRLNTDIQFKFSECHTVEKAVLAIAWRNQVTPPALRILPRRR